MKILLLSLFLFFSFTTVGQHIFELVGSVPSKIATITLEALDSTFNTITTSAQNGVFKISGNLNENFGYASLLIKDSVGTIGWWTFFIQPGKMKFRLNNNTKAGHYKPSYFNIPFREENEAYERLKLDHQNQYQKVVDYLRIHYDRKKQLADSINKVYRDINDDWINNLSSLIKKDYNSYINLYIFKNDIVNSHKSLKRVSIDSMCFMYSRFNESLRNTKIGISVGRELEKRKSLTIGKPAPDFFFTDSLANQYQLSHLYKDKMVLLCFWNVGCKPCIESFPFLKFIYSTYGKSVEIISVSLDSRDVIWKNALKRHNLPWINTCDINEYVTGDNIAPRYNIQYIPQYFLIDKKGEIIYHNIQLSDTDSYDGLLQILSEITLKESLL